MTESTSQPAVTGAGIAGACANCGTLAAFARTFCGACGARLWEPCLGCGTRNSVAERFCSQCGANLAALLAAAMQAIDERLARAAELERQGKLLEGAECLADVAGNDHSELAPRLDEVLRRREQLSKARLAAVTQQASIVDEARRLQEERKFADALALLEKVPASIRNQETRTLFAELQQQLAEIKRLRAALAKSLSNGHRDGELPIAERLAELEPHAGDVRRVCEQLRQRRRRRDGALAKELLAKARDAIVVNDYVLAGEYVDRTPPADNANDRKLLAAIKERVWLARQMRVAPFADQTLLAIAARLAKLKPNDENAGKTKLEIAARLARAENGDGHAYVPWARPVANPRLGASVEPITRIAKIHWDSHSPSLTSWVANLRRHLVALGLARCGLGDAPFGELEFQLTTSSWLGRLIDVGRRRASAAWGLDFGTSGLKIVRLVRQKDVIAVDRSGIIDYQPDHSAAQRSATADELPDIQLLLAPAFEQFLKEYSPGDDPLVISFPGAQSLGRFFTLPPMKSTRLRAALRMEVASQIPLPAEEVVYAAHFWKAEAGKGRAAKHHVACVAAKRAHVELRAGPFAEFPPRRWSIQSECVALLNVLLDCQDDPLAQLNPDQAIALIEAGDTSTHLVAVSPDRGPWFRTIHRGVRSLNRRLVGAFGVTWQQADEMRQQRSAKQPMAKVDWALLPGIEEWTREVERTLDAYRETMQARVVRIYVAGGGCDQFGLLREWLGRGDAPPVRSPSNANA